MRGAPKIYFHFPFFCTVDELLFIIINNKTIIWIYNKLWNITIVILSIIYFIIIYNKTIIWIYNKLWNIIIIILSIIKIIYTNI